MNFCSTRVYACAVYITGQPIPASKRFRLRQVFTSKVIMRVNLTIILLVAAFLQISFAADGQKVTLMENNASLKSVLRQIRTQTSYNIICDAEILKQASPVTVSVNDLPLREALDQCLKPQSLSYIIIDNTVIITRQQPVKEKSTPAEVVRIIISGTVSDDKGEPLAGASVRLKGGTAGVSTNEKGQFSLQVTEAVGTLVISFVGFETREEPIRGRSIITITLLKKNTAFDDVVVIGYGSMRQKDITGSISNAPVSDMKKAPVVSFDQALAGRVAGVDVRSDDGQPGAAMNIVIRGGNSITQSNSPLYVVDDFPLENNENNSINPADIESIVILKDAAATAIYGSRGANGVVLITTKRGKAGEPVIKYDASLGFQNKIKKIDLLSPYEFVRLQLEIDSANATANYLSGGKSLDDYRNVQAVDWYSKIFQHASMMTHNISASGGTAKSKFAVSGSYANQDGIIINSGFKRYQGRASLDQTLTDRLKLGMSVNYAEFNSYGTIVNNIEQSGISGPYMYSVWSYRPVKIDGELIEFEEELFDPNVQTGGGFNDRRVNPLVQAQNEVRETRTNNLYTSANLEYTILRGLKLKITGGISKNVAQDIAFNNSKTRTGSPLYPLSLGVNGKNIFTETRNYVNENTLTFDRVFSGIHIVNVVAGFSQQKNTVTASGIEAIQLPNESLGISGLDQGTARTITATSSASQLRSLFGRIAYNFKSKYSVQATFRADGSSKFAYGHQWAYFPSVGVRYSLIEESFLHNLKFLSDARVRASFGYSGNNRVTDFAYLTSIGFPTTNAYSFNNATPQYGGAPTGLGNRDLKWESTKTYDFGIDLGFFDNRLTLTVDYYDKKTYDLLLNAQIPGSSGYTTAFKNIGSVGNKGLEITLSSINVYTKSFRWNSSFNISFNRNRILSLTEGQESILSTSGGPFGNIPKNIAKVGQPVALFYGAIFEGLYPYDDFYQLSNGAYVLKDEIASNGTTRSGIQPGHAKYRDLNGDGIVNTDDFTIIGNPNPDFIGGFNNNFEYKNFDLNLFFRFSYGNDILNANRIVFEGQDNYTFNTNMYATYANRWSPTNTHTDIPNRAGRGPQYWSTRIIEDGSMLRLGVVALGYTYSGKILKRINMKSIRFNFAANNLFTWTNYSGLDPEVSVRSTNLTPGMDYSAYPRARTITFGLNATF